MSDELQRPTTDDRAAWKAYWEAQGMPWRTEPEIDVERQRFLAERRAVKPDIEKGIYPFRDENGSIALTRADVEWLLATHESSGMCGPVDWNDEKQKRREGLELYGADLREVNLSYLPLAKLQGGLPALVDVGEELVYKIQRLISPSSSQELHTLFSMAAIDLERANLTNTCLQHAVLDHARLQRASFKGASLHQSSLIEAEADQAMFDGAHLDSAFLEGTHLEAASFVEAFLNRTDLSCAHLEATVFDEAEAKETKFSKSFMEGARVIAAHLEDAHLDQAHLEGALLAGCHLERSRLWEAHLEGADLTEAHLEGADLTGAHLEGTELSVDNLKRVEPWTQPTRDKWWWWDRMFPSELPPANLRGVFFDVATQLKNVSLGSKARGYVALSDVHWNSVNLAVVRWSDLELLGDEREARCAKGHSGQNKLPAERFVEHEAAVRANRQLASELRSQGLNEQADRFAYRGQILQRQLEWLYVRWGCATNPWQTAEPPERGWRVPDSILWQFGLDSEESKARLGHSKDVETKQAVSLQAATQDRSQALALPNLDLGVRIGHWMTYMGSLLLDLVSGYGYKPLRSVFTYLFVVVGFAFLYFLMRDSVHPALKPMDAIIFSITSFHGRGFNPGESVTLHNPLTIVASIEAIVGLLIEITFIATFTQRFLAR